MLLIQALPLLALVALLATGRAGPLLSCLVALLLTLPAAWADHAGVWELGSFVGRSIAEGLWLAVIPVGIITGGLVFHATVAHRAERLQKPAVSTDSTADQLFTNSFMLGPFTESVTGFGVGSVFAISSVRNLGVAGAPAAAIGLIAQTIIPWGGLGPGTSIGAALAGLDPQLLAARNAWLVAPAWLLILPLFWWWCRLAGVTVSARSRVLHVVWAVLMGALLIAGHWVLPWQLCGMTAAGLALTIRLLLANPPRNADGWLRAGHAAGPYLLLAALLGATQLWHNAPALHPYAGLPGLPINHAMVALWLAALIMLTFSSRGFGFVLPAIKRARRPALAMLGFVVLARVLANAGVPVALAAALVASFGVAAPFAAPLLSAMSGFFAGTNVGANSAMMPLQAALGRASGLGPVVLPAVQNGSLALVISPQLAAVSAGLAGDGVTPARIWRIMWPLVPIALLIGAISIVIG
jgi:lactate permease